ncbi:MAG: hypothetical protein NVS9B3_06140 [Gemmatimonadaceae bacterium]
MAEHSGSGERIVFTPDDMSRHSHESPDRPTRSPAAAVLALVRWPNAGLAGAGVLAGAWWVGGPIGGRRTMAAAAAAIALTAVANAYNDYCDRALDAVAHPERPLPRGELPAGDAVRVAAVAALAAATCALAAGRLVAIATPIVIALMVLYSARLKAAGVIGNIVVAVLASLPFAYGGASAGATRAALPLVAVAIPLHLAREIAKDIDDAAADAGLRRTVPLVLGHSAARRAMGVSLAIFVLALATLARGRPLFAIAAAPALVLAGLGARRAFAGTRGAPQLLKAAMGAALAALVVARM